MNHFFLATLFALLAAIAASTAEANSGRTADGCSYRIINGQYLTSCENKAKEAAPLIAVADPVITSYDAVPVRASSIAPAPQAPVSTLRVRVPVPSQGEMAEEAYESRRRRDRDEAVDSTYVGAQIGSTNIKNAGSGTGLGVSLGTNVDDHVGFELGYSYANQDLNLGLSSRGINDIGGMSAPTPLNSRYDSSLKAHLITGEVQGYLTDTFKRLRPYVGVGLGYQASSLKEAASSSGFDAFSGAGSAISSSNSAAGTLKQSSLGALGSAGAKLRLGKGFNLALAFRYFFPIARQESRLESAGGAFAPATRLTKDDSALTGAGQYQLNGGVQYSF